MSRPGDAAAAAGRGKRFRSSGGGGGDAVTGGAGFLAGVACALLFALWKHAHGELLVPSALLSSEVSAEFNTSAAAVGQVRGSATAGTDARKAAQPVNFTGTKDWTSAVTAAAMAAADAVEHQIDVDSLPILFLSYGNAAYFNFVHNWAVSVQQIGAPYVIGSFDDAMLDLCANHSLPCVRAQFATADDFRTNFAAFRAMGAVKVLLVLEILERHPKLPLLVVSDSDTVWLRQPWTYFNQRPAADFFVSSDCLSHRMEDEWQPGHDKVLCGHVPGNAGVAFNTGLFAARNRPATRAFLRAWFETLTDSGKEHHSDSEHRGIDDQLALNLMFDPGLVSAIGPDEPRTILVYNGSLRVQTLPVVLFSGGHVAFVQRTPWKLGVEPIAIHMTWQRWARAGKVARLREFGLWRMDPPAYYGAGPHNTSTAYLAEGGDDRLWLLTYQNDVEEFVERMARQRYEGGRMPLFYKHWLGMSYQLAAFREALVVARLLRCTLVPPTLWCWCDYDEVPNSGILETCLINAGDYRSPFQCPLDFLLPIEVLDNLNISYRPPGFLDLPQVPASIRNSRAVLNIVPSQPGDPLPEAVSMVGHGVTLWTSMPQFALDELASTVSQAAVLELRGQLPGLVLDFLQDGDAAAFDKLFESVLAEAFWCCFTWGEHDEEYRQLQYAAPPPYAVDGEEWKPWEPPVLEVPEWCDKVSTADGNNEFTRLPQHPCAFLRDPEAARIAAGDAQPAA